MRHSRKKISLAISILFVLLMVITAFADAETDTNTLTLTKNKIGKFGDSDYELWRDKGEAVMNVNIDGTFSCEWDKSKTGNVLFRTGKKFDQSRTHEEIGEFSLEYGCDYQPVGNSYLSVYGWSVDPLVEFYILESFTTYNPGTDGTTYKGSVTVDGDTYSIYEGLRVDQPSIKGTKTTFPQYWSIRENKRTEGTVSISEHFKAWEEAGLELGNLYEVALAVEGYHSSGTANVYKNVLTYGDTTIGTVPEAEETEETSEIIEAGDAAAEIPHAADGQLPEDASVNADSETSSSMRVSVILIIIVALAVIAVGVAVITRRRR